MSYLGNGSLFSCMSHVVLTHLHAGGGLHEYRVRLRQATTSSGFWLESQLRYGVQDEDRSGWMGDEID
jgi:hypothetical protein